MIPGQYVQPKMADNADATIAHAAAREIDRHQKAGAKL